MKNEEGRGVEERQQVRGRIGLKDRHEEGKWMG